MFFKHLEIQGFKSFPDKTVLSFDSKMTAIIGSNGNGKSNISDALRWVMGEQGAKTLRGDKMEDVIFHGTETRKQMGFASVTLSVDNADRALPVDSDEVIITRKLYRSGESEYLINNQKSRLKDIQETLMGTGLGRDGYSIIGQGRVAEIVGSKGRERREIFDEAAGVSKFLHKKAESERELARAGENILRLLDISKELEDRLPILEKQSEKAIKAKELIEQEKNLEISVSIAELAQIEQDILKIDDDILMNEGEFEHFDREITELEEEFEEKTENKMLLGVKIGELRSLSDSVKDKVAEADKKAAVMSAEIEHNNNRKNAVNEQINNSKKDSAEFDKQIEALKKELSAKQAEFETARIEIQKSEAELEKISSENFGLDAEHKLLDRELGLLHAKQTEQKLTLAQAENNAADFAEQFDSADYRFANQNEQVEETRKKRRALRSELDNLNEEKQENENKLKGYEHLFSAKNDKLNNAKTELQKLTNEYDEKHYRYSALADVEKNMAGYFSSVKAVITASKQGRLSEIHGTVADIIKVDSKYSTAIEVALGAALQNIIVSNEETAKRCIQFLKETNSGRATFLPLTSVKGKTLDEAFLNNEDGFLGFGYELINYDKKYDNIIRSILGKTAVTEDINTATFLAKKYGYRFRIVTLDGQIINAGGSFTGGSIKESAGIISRKQELQALETSLKSLDEKLTSAKIAHAALTAEVNKMSIELQGYKENITKLINEETRLNAEIKGIDNLIAQYEEQLDNSETIKNKLSAQIKLQKEIILNCNKNLSEIAQDLENKNRILSGKSSELEAAEIKRESISEKVAELKLKTFGIEKDAENIENKITSVTESKNNLGAGTDALLKELSDIEQKNSELRADIEKSQSEIEKTNTSYTENQNEINLLMTETSSIEQRIFLLNKEIREKIEHREKFATALALAKEKRAGAENEAERIKSSLWDKYELVPSEAKNLAEPLENIRKARGELAEIRRKITALGNVNFAAIEEYTEVGERFKVLSAQISDLEKSKSDLEKLIANLTIEIKEKFLESFNIINLEFGRIFTEIFGGGNAHLELTDPDDILGSGIEIFAAPPGKLVKNLISLSGGEQAMVAITIYFAILLHRPTPFCMLDEVDAALDEANIVKYISYLKRFSNKTQLMIITHRRGTIEGCDVLYGVFMQEKGVSRLLKQDLAVNLDMEFGADS